MRRNTTSTESSTIALTIGEARSRGALIGSFLLLVVSFLLLVLAPVLMARFQAESQAASGGFLPLAAASGIALGGGAAMIAVVSRLVRDIEARPYAGLAPVLAIFAGFVLWGLRAKLPLEGVPSEYAGLFSLMVSVVGGALVAQRGVLARVGGWAIAFFGPLTLLMLVWAGSGHGELGVALGTLSPQLKMFLGLSACSALAMVVLGEASRVLSRATRTVEAVHALPKTTQSFARSSVDEPLFNAPSMQRSAPVSTPLARAYEGAPAYSAHAPEGAPAYSAHAPEGALRHEPAVQYDAHDVFVPDVTAPKVNVWDLDDDELPLPKRFAWWKVLLLSALLLGGTAAAVYYGVILPNRDQEHAAAVALQEKQALIDAESKREADAKRALDSKAATERLEAMLAAPAPSAEATPLEATAPAAAEQPAEEPPHVATPALVPEQPGARVEPAAAKRAAPARTHKPEKRAPRPSGPGGSLSGSASDDPIYGL